MALSQREDCPEFRKEFFSAQFHPEASSGPVDTEFFFDDFISRL